jgi:cytochrome c551/c552
MKPLVFAAVFSAATLLAQAPAGDAANGKKLFLRDGCYECHG